MGTPSKFFATFSLQELVYDGEPGPSSSPQRGLLGARGIGGGVAGGGIGGGSGYIADRPSGEAHWSKSESLSLSVIVSGRERFDEPGFVESLKTRLEKRIIDKAAVITEHGDMPGSFHTNEFYFEYQKEKVRGRIVISGRLSETTYRMRAHIEERSEAGGFDVHQSSDGGLSFADAFRMMKPEGDYHVVALDRDHPLSGPDRLQQLAQELIRNSVDRLRRGMPPDARKDLKFAEVWTLAKWPPQIERLLPEMSDLENRFEVPAEYQGYETVLFLNDVALKMYGDAGFALEVIKTISSSEMPTSAHRTLRVPYFLKS